MRTTDRETCQLCGCRFREEPHKDGCTTERRAAVHKLNKLRRAGTVCSERLRRTCIGLGKSAVEATAALTRFAAGDNRNKEDGG